MPRELKISLDNSAGVYYPGQLLAGQVMVHSTETLYINEVTIQLKGHCRVKWSVEQKDRYLDQEQNEIYFDTEIKLASTGESGTLDSGYHFYDFSYLLPPNIPSSYEGTHGFVRYTCIAEVHRHALRTFSWSEKIGFSIISVYDLNLLPALLSPRNFQYHRQVSFFLMDQGHVYFDITLPRTGYVCGEAICPIIKIDNKSSKAVERITVSLQQYAVYRNHGLLEYGNNMVCEVDAEGCKANTSQVSNNIALMIPALPPSGLINCSLIDVKFSLWIEFHMPLFVRNIKMPMDITIGTIPFRTFYPYYYPYTPVTDSTGPSAPMLDRETSSFNVQGGPGLPSQDYDAPPPSYEQAMSCVPNCPVLGEEDFSFTPKYAVYRPREEYVTNQFPSNPEKC